MHASGAPHPPRTDSRRTRARSLRSADAEPAAAAAAIRGVSAGAQASLSMRHGAISSLSSRKIEAGGEGQGRAGRSRVEGLHGSPPSMGPGLPVEVGGGLGTSPEGRGDMDMRLVAGGLDEAGTAVCDGAMW